MARRLRAILPLILVVSFLLFGVSNSSRPLPRPEFPAAAPAAHVDQEPLRHPGAAETGTRPVTVETAAEDGGHSRAHAHDDGEAPPSLATAASPRDKEQGGVVVVGSRHRSAPLALGLTPPALQRSKLARRFLAGVVEGADSAARASCHSSDVHIGCTPPSEH